MRDGSGTLQMVIEKLLDGLAMEEIGLAVLKDPEACERTRQRFGLVRAFVGEPVRRRRGETAFWVRLEDALGEGVALVSARRVITDDLGEEIASGRLWLEGGFAANSGLSRIECKPSWRVLHGAVSVLEIGLVPKRSISREVIWGISWLAQALALKHHESDFIACLPDMGLNADSEAAMADAFHSVDPCIDGPLPPFDRHGTLPLLHTSRQEFLTWGVNMIATETKADRVAMPVNLVS